MVMDTVENNHFWFIAKRKFLDVVLQRIRANKKIKVLDVGCGTGAVMKYLATKNFLVSGIDMSETAHDYCRKKGLEVSSGLANIIPYPDKSFDIIFVIDVLEHLDNPSESVKEISRVLKDGGVFIATVPAHQWLWSYHDEALHHKKRYSKKEFADLFNDGFVLEIISWIHAFILLPAIFMRFFKNKNNGSDVKEPPFIINKIMSLVYTVEIIVFKTLHYYLPFGLSLLVVARKKKFGTK